MQIVFLNRVDSHGRLVIGKIRWIFFVLYLLVAKHGKTSKKKEIVSCRRVCSEYHILQTI